MADYRYHLARGIGFLTGGKGCLGWVMLNPSTADATQDDPTIRKVRGFTARAGFARQETKWHFADGCPDGDGWRVANGVVDGEGRLAVLWVREVVA